MNLGRPKSATSKQIYFPVTVNLLPSEWELFKELTNATGIGRSWLIRKWIRAYIQEHKGDKNG